MATELRDTEVVTGKVQLQFVHLAEPKGIGDGPKKYQAMVVFDANDRATLKSIQKAIEAAKQKGIAEVWGGKEPRKLKLPLRDGEEEFPDDENFEGKMFLNAYSARQPILVDRKVKPIRTTDIEDELYSGVYARVNLNFYPYAPQNGGGSGIAVGLEMVQKVADGERLGGGGPKDPGAVFDPVDDEDADLI